jgi:transcriptional regulator with XRE-family HTH domain
MSELGSWLIRAREARGLTLEDAERDTRISRRYLQALETEQFDVIPAPVYARGFLRSYSQYLGLDPQEVLALFPRDEEPGYAAPPPPPSQARPGQQQPVSAVGASRPTWKRPPQSRAASAPPRPATNELPFEPTIGIDIGVPTPARRIKTDPAAQTRSLTVLVVAVAAVLLVLLLAIAISKLGGGDDSAGTSPGAGAGSTATAPPATPTTPAGASGLATTPGIVPNVEGKQVATARQAVTEAGFAVSEKHQKDAKPKGTVLQQSPAAGTDKSSGISTVTIVVSDGP